jgi:hypothetical protein
MQNINDKSALLNQSELAHYLRRSEAWCERARWQGNGPRFIKVGRKPFYRLSDVESWLEAQTRVSTSDRGAA